MTKRDFPPISPGEVLQKEFLEPYGMSQYRLAKEIHVAAVWHGAVPVELLNERFDARHCG